MNSGPSSFPSGISIVGMVPQVTDATRQEAAPSRRHGAIDVEWGRSESLDPNNVGDIADEGAGHRG
jgi:hypothetical protein